MSREHPAQYNNTLEGQKFSMDGGGVQIKLKKNRTRNVNNVPAEKLGRTSRELLRSEPKLTTKG